MNEKFDDSIVEVIEVASKDTANDYLDQNWVLLCTGFTHVPNPKDKKEKIGIFVYCLGRPQSVRNPERDQAIIEHNMRRIMCKSD